MNNVLSILLIRPTGITEVVPVQKTFGDVGYGGGFASRLRTLLLPLT